jgi:cell wall-associated NlpC family hydrolase
MVNVMRTRRAAVACVLAGTMLVSLVSLSTSAATPRQDLQQVAAKVRDLQMQAESAAQRAGEAQTKLNGINAQLNSIRNRSAREQADLRIAMTTIDDIARSAYVSGGMDPTLEVLMADDPAQFLAQAAVMGQLEQTQIGQMRHAQTTRLRVAQTQAEITDKEAAAKQVRDEMDAAKQESDDRLSDAQDVLAGLQEEERQRLAQLAEERRQQQIAEAAAAAARAAQLAQDSSNSSTSSGSDAAESGGGFSGGSRAEAAVQYALSQVGKPYSFSASPPSSWDCSKLTAAAWGQAGVGLTALSYSQWDETQRVPVSDIQPGDLVFYFGGGAHHVAIYIGGGKMVSASNPSDGVEIIDFLGPWYGERFSGVGRVV